jgi:hypothetical protein
MLQKYLAVAIVHQPNPSALSFWVNLSNFLPRLRSILLSDLTSEQTNVTTYDPI